MNNMNAAFGAAKAGLVSLVFGLQFCYYYYLILINLYLLGNAFDPIGYVMRPQVILRFICWVCH